MADSALIDDLEKQFADNPRRVFARLANEYRKAGDPERAIEICRHHVPQQPGYISGHIVLGQALFDTGQFDEARGAFETALGLDPENLIALRQLGDIARETGDIDGAGSWYRRLLEVDPQNDEVAEQLQALSSAAPMAEPAAAASDDQEQVRWGDIHPEDVHREAENAASDSAPSELAEDAPDDGTPSDSTPLPFIALAPEPDASAAPSATAPAEQSSAADASSTADIVLDTSAIDEPANAAETAAPPVIDIEALSPAAESAAPAAPETESTPVPAAITPEAPETTAGAAEEPESDAQSEQESTDASDQAPSDAFFTETMAELYVRQGFVEKALDIYRHLARQSPDDAGFQSAIDELEQVLASGAATPATGADDGDVIGSATSPVGPTIREFLSGIAARRAAVRPESASTDGSSSGGSSFGGSRDDTLSESSPADADTVSDDGFSSSTMSSAPRTALPAPTSESPAAVDELFSDRPVASHDDAAAGTLASGYSNGMTPEDGRRGSPARTAPDALSLDAVFGRAQSNETSGRRGSSVSFDEFFASDTPGSNGASPASTGHAQPDASAPSDLELFHAWLEGLKR
jgi:tetratricopeptide (TPR) repeat protein